jgi:excisionase family DNA binding protein
VYTQVTKKSTREHLKEQSGMLRTGEVCRILCIHSNTLRRWSKQGIVKAYRVGPRGDRRFRREDISALLIEKTRDSGTDTLKLSHQ